MAPPKAWFTQRMISADLFGINWAKTCWKTPYTNMYPLSNSGGQPSRTFSTPIYFGNKEHRETRNQFRHGMLVLPSVFVGIVFIFQLEYYQMVQIAYFLMRQDVPEPLQEEQRKKMLMYSREKPGYVLKHKLGGQVSIPGSEINVLGADEDE